LRNFTDTGPTSFKEIKETWFVGGLGNCVTQVALYPKLPTVKGAKKLPPAIILLETSVVPAD